MITIEDLRNAPLYYPKVLEYEGIKYNPKNFIRAYKVQEDVYYSVGIEIIEVLKGTYIILGIDNKKIDFVNDIDFLDKNTFEDIYTRLHRPLEDPILEDLFDRELTEKEPRTSGTKNSADGLRLNDPDISISEAVGLNVPDRPDTFDLDPSDNFPDLPSVSGVDDVADSFRVGEREVEREFERGGKFRPIGE